ncbi:MAG: DsbC family protein [Methylococcales bacterium]|nr:DsbC family protein [Methylococcales bacterium]
MKKINLILILLLGAVVNASVSADEAAIKKTLGGFMPQEKIDQIKPSEIKGLYEARIGANIFYVSEDGKYVLQGQLYDTEAKKNLTETKLAEVRKSALDNLGTGKMIVFKPQTSKYTVSVFTDIDCGYCRKLHSEMDQYLAEGITVRYLFFPRAGKGSDSYNKAISVWCATDRNKALTAAKKNEGLEIKTCENPIDEQMQLGEDFGMSGTPMIVTEKGNILPGYVPAGKLASILAKENNTP